MLKNLPLVCAFVGVLSLAPALLAQDSDRSRVDDWLRRTVTTRIRQELPTQTVGYYPTLRYYGKDFTVHYGYVPVTRQTIRRIDAADTELLPPTDFVGDPNAARLIVGTRRPPGAAPTFRAAKIKVRTVTTTEKTTQDASTEPVQPPPAEAATESSATASPAAIAPSGPLQPALPSPAETVVQPPAAAK